MFPDIIQSRKLARSIINNKFYTNKYKSVSVHIDTHNKLNKISSALLDNTRLSISKTIELLANEKAKKLNGKLSTK